jgi:DNA-binding response OmpR family regulator
LEKKIKVHIFCLKPDICNLIKKFLSQSKYYITCTPAKSVDNEFLGTFKERFDCVILDIDIDNAIKEKVKQRFQKVPIICLPSLEADVAYDSGIKYISEPLKLSELVKTLDELFGDKKAS